LTEGRDQLVDVRIQSSVCGKPVCSCRRRSKWDDCVKMPSWKTGDTYNVLSILKL